jgi:hypothetical protein
MAKKFSCPTCGAPHTVENPGVVMSVCEYCSNAVIWDEDAIRDAGKRATLPEGFTRLYRGATGRLFKKRFLVLGRVRYSFGRGFWDEWYVELQNGSTGWLTEDNHELALQQAVPDVNVRPFDSYMLNTSFKVGDSEFVVQELGQARCLGLEGDLPRALEPDESYPYVDASSPDGRYTLGIEYDDERPSVFRGRWVKHASLKLDDSGRDW